LRSRELLRKELAELFASRAWWLLLIVIGMLTGQAFIQSVNAYAEASGPGSLAQALSPLDGIVVPTLGASELAIMLLFPFVAVRLISGERSSDALKLTLQWPFAMRQHLGAKLAALLVAWLVSLVPFAVAMTLWTGYRGHLHAPEVLTVLAGYTLRFAMTMTIAMAAAAMMPGAANAAIAVLAFTIGTWAVDFLATGRGGWIERVAEFTPAAALRNFERGLLRADVVAVMLVIALVALALTAIWLPPGTHLRRRIVRTIACAVAAAIALTGAAALHPSADTSEDRRNSFAPADEQTLASIHAPLVITAWLAAEDPRLNDFERNVLVKLRRALPSVDVRYPYAGRSALFENDSRYGTIEYTIAGRHAVSRSTTEEIVLDTIYGLAGVRAPARSESTYGGYPLVAQPRGAATLFYVVWPLAVIAARVIARRPRSRRTG
jgi:ABC-2 type transport system permease protein